ncbi:MAG: hypothetical protein QM535_01270 [Limnohabitans sp.]|nr:hypothetical protein [Limnohabitans sp.]
MKKITLLILLLLNQLSFSQDYSLLRKAEKKLEKKEYDKALRLLNRAEKADYGFCGNASIEALYKIDSLKLRLFKESKDLIGLQKFLDNINFEFNERYSKERIFLALNFYKKEELKRLLIESILNSDRNNLESYFGIVNFKLSDKYRIKLFFKDFNVLTIMRNENITYNEAVIKIFQKSVYWDMLN